MQYSKSLQSVTSRNTLRLEACKKECTFYQEHGKQFHRKHLENRKQIALEQEDKEAFKKISAIIQREQQRSFWHKLNYVIGKKKTRSATSIQVKRQDGVIMEHTMQKQSNKLSFQKYMRKGTRWQEKH